jgi:hypothetical protein
MLSELDGKHNFSSHAIASNSMTHFVQSVIGSECPSGIRGCRVRIAHSFDFDDTNHGNDLIIGAMKFSIAIRKSDLAV